MTEDSGSRPPRVSRRALAGTLLAIAVVLAVIAWATMGHRARSPAQGREAGQGTAMDGGGRGEAGRPIAVRVEAVTQGSVDMTVSAMGTVAALKTATIHSRVDGPLIAVPFREGQRVKAGEVLARIDPRTFQAQLAQAEGQLARDEAQLAGARIDLERYRALLAQDSIQKQQVDDQQYTVHQLEATVQADRGAVASARLQVEFTRVTAPFDGRVGLRQVDPGNMVHAADANGLVVLTQTHPIYVVFAVPAATLGRLWPRWLKNEAMPVEALGPDGGLIARGRLEAIDNQLDQTTGTVKLKGLFPNTDDALFPAQFVNARLTIETIPEAVLAPQAAVQRGAQGNFVYVVGGDERVTLRTVTLGPGRGDRVSVTRGLRPGERVVIDGLDKLRDGSPVTVITPAARPAAAGADTGRPHRRNATS